MPTSAPTLRPQDVAARLGLSRRTAAELLDSGRIRSFRLRRVLRCSEDALAEFIAAHTVEAAAEVGPPQATRPAEQTGPAPWDIPTAKSA